ncbi:MAG: hypothetical protein N4A46_08690 [Schleiferiaceae bacterium]|jgi:hypothetical protein|nr:hypothetical protein [Schleiferiaceae bacterium]
MRKITLDNYEEFFLDYMEGNLSAQEQIVLDEFLVQYPELKEELEEMEIFSLVEEDVQMGKESLKEIPFKSDFDDFCVAKIEGDLSLEEEFIFDEFVNANPKRIEDVKLYKKTKLYPDHAIIYPDKESLQKKKRKLLPLWISGVGIAASILLLFSIWNDIFVERSGNSFNEADLARLAEQSASEVKIEKPEAKDENKALLVEKEEVNITNEKPMAKPAEKPISRNIIKEEIEIREVVSLPEIGVNDKTELIANADVPDENLNLKVNATPHVKVNSSGMQHLGMSWKSSTPKKAESLLSAVAKFGVNKLGEIAGKKIQLEKKYDSETEKTRLNFNSKGLGFSTTLK